MSTPVLDAPPAPVTETDGPPPAGLTHYWCCNPNVAICGVPLKGNDVGPDGEVDCVVCIDLDDAGVPCRYCG